MPEDYSNNTITFSMEEVREADMKRILLTVYDALKEKGIIPSARLWDTSSLRTPPISQPTTTPAASSAGLTATSF